MRGQKKRGGREKRVGGEGEGREKGGRGAKGEVAREEGWGREVRVRGQEKRGGGAREEWRRRGVGGARAVVVLYSYPAALGDLAVTTAVFMTWLR